MTQKPTNPLYIRDVIKILNYQPTQTAYPRPHSDSSADLHLDAELRSSSRPESVPCSTYNGVGLLVLANNENGSIDRPISPLPDDAFRISNQGSFQESSPHEKNIDKEHKCDERSKVTMKSLSHTEALSKDLKDEINFGTMKTNISLPIFIPRTEFKQDLDEIASVSSRGSLAEFERMENAMEIAESTENIKDALLILEEDGMKKGGGIWKEADE